MYFNGRILAFALEVLILFVSFLHMYYITHFLDGAHHIIGYTKLSWAECLLQGWTIQLDTYSDFFYCLLVTPHETFPVITLKLLFIYLLFNFLCIREQTSFCWYFFEGSRIFGFRCPTCSPSVPPWTQVGTRNYCFIHYCMPTFLLFLWVTTFFLLFKVKLTTATIAYCRKDLPLDLAEGVLQALSLQALGHVYLNIWHPTIPFVIFWSYSIFYWISRSIFFKEDS